MAPEEEIAQDLMEKRLEDVNYKCSANLPQCFVYSSTPKTLQEKRKQMDLEVQKKYKEFLEKMKSGGSAAGDLNVVSTYSKVTEHLANEDVEFTTKAVEVFNQLSSYLPSPLVIGESGSKHPIRRNVELNERMRKIERRRRKQQEDMEMNLLDSEDDSRLDLHNVKESCLADVNPKLIVKINHSGVIIRHDMCMNDRFLALKLWLASETGVEASRFSLVLDSRTLKSEDTPASIGLTISDILDFIPTSESQSSKPVCHEQTNLVKLILKTGNFREQFEFSINNDSKMATLLHAFAKKFGRDVTKLELHFDGEMLDLARTVTELGLEDEYQIDVIERD